MKKFLSIFCFLLLAVNSKSQDLALATPSGDITAPVSGCGLSATETVTVRIFNFGATLIAGSTFNVSYSVNGGGPVTELVTLASNFTSNSSLNYSFTTTANLSVAGTYTIDATVSIVGDVSPANNTYSGYTITNSSPSVGGIVSSSMNVCITANNGTLTLAGHTGNVIDWEFSTDNGTTWFTISNTSTSQSFTNLVDTTLYRVKVQNASCAAAFSDTVTVTPDKATVGGTLSSNASVCATGNGATLNLSGKTGSVLQWEFSTDNFATTTVIPNLTTSQAYSNLLVTTKYRVLVQSGTCASAYSSTVTITVSPVSVGGSITPDTSFGCAGNNTGVLTLSGQVGTNQGWQISTNGVTFANVAPANTTSTLTYNNLAGTRWYRVTIKSGGCATTRSDTAVVIVSSVTVAGSLSSSDTVCTGNNLGTITLAGNNGTVTNWESSIDNGATWSNIANTTNSEAYNNLTTSTLYRALVQSGGCLASYSDTVKITVDTLTLPGVTNGATTVCMGANAGNVNLTGNNGTVVNWMSSIDGGTTWNNIANTTTTQSFTNINDSTLFAAVVKNGVCPNDTSSAVGVAIDSTTIGGSVTLSDTVCSGNNADTLVISGDRGNVVNWEASTDGGLTWLNIVNVTDSQAYNNLTLTTLYRTLVKNGVCASVYSNYATIAVDAVPVAGAIFGGTTVCQGANTGNLTLFGNTAGIKRWEFSTDNGATWTSIPNITAINSYTNLMDTTYFQAIIGSGVCPDDTSTVGIVFIDSVSTGGVISIDDTVCAGSNNDTLVLSGTFGNVTNWQYSTDGGNTWLTLANTTLSQIYNNLNSTTQYQAQVKNGVCPSASSAIATITVDPASDAGTISSAASVCEGSNTGVLTISGQTGAVVDWISSTDGIVWSPIGNTTLSLTYTNLIDTTWYKAIVLNGICPNDTGLAVKITVNPRPIVAFSAPDTCFGLPTVFANTTTVPSGFVQIYNWDFGDNNNSITGNPVHTYSDTGTFNVSLVALSNLGCLDTLIVPVKVKALPSVTFTASGPYQFCDNDSLVLSIPLDTNNVYLWNTGDTINQITIDTTGTWSITVVNSLTGCSNADSVQTVVFVAPVANAGADDTVSLGNSITLNGSGGLQYLWTPAATLSFANIAQPSATPADDITYTVAVTDINGCTDLDSVRIVVVSDFTLEINTIITPNGDGFNDVWFIKNLTNYPDNEVTIFNRYGQKVFSMSTYDNSWGGTSGGNLLPDGTYYYAIKFTGSDKEYTGAITILKSEK